MRFLIKYSAFTKILTIFAGCSCDTGAHNNADEWEAKSSTPVGFADMRRQSYKKILNFEAYFLKISSIGAARHGIPELLLRSYSRK